jgi:hypothetical protein
MTGCGGGGGGGTTTVTTTTGGGGGTTTALQVSASPAVLQGGAGMSAAITLNITLQTGYSGMATATITGLPQGVTISVAQPISLAAGTQQIPIVCDGTTAAGTYTLTLTITAGGQSSSTSFSLTVSAPVGTTLGVSISSPTISAGQGTQMSVMVTVPSGFNGAVTGMVTGLPSGITLSSSQPIPLLPGTQNIAIGASNTVTAGSYPITLTITAGTQTAMASGTLTVNVTGPAALGIPVNSIFLSPGEGNSIDLQCIPSGGIGSCTLSTTITGLPTGVGVNPSMPFNVTTAGTVITFTAGNSITLGQYPITFTGKVGPYETTFNVTLVVGYADFWFLTYNPIPLVVRYGSQASVSLNTGSSAGAGLESNYTLTMTVSGLPPGTTGTLTPSVIAPGQSTTLTVAAAANGPLNRNYSVEVTATPSISTEQPQSVQLDVSVVPPVGQLPNDRSDYVETDGEVVSAVYDAVHQIVFASVPNWGVVDVISPATKKIVGSIPIPAPHLLSWSLDGTHIIVGTNSSQLFWIDPSTMRVDKRVVLPQNQQAYPSPANGAIELADGTFLLSGGSNIWNPATNSYSMLSLGNVGGPVQTVVSADGTKVLCKEEGGMGVQLYDVLMGAVTQSLTFPQVVSSIAINPSGTKFLIGDYTRGVGIYDQNLTLINTIIGASTSGGEPVGMMFSSDGALAYIDDGAIYTYDTSANAVLGISPGPAGVPLTLDTTGLIFLDASQGLTISDSTNFVTLVTAAPGLSAPIPNVGPVGQATTVTFNSGLEELADFYFGGQPGTQESLASGSDEVTVTTPAITQAGPVNMKTVSPEGGVAIQPLAFSYGPWLQYLRGSAGDPAGGASAGLVALGLPSNGVGVQVSVGGVPATGVQVSTLAAYLTPYGYPEKLVTFTLPPGSPGAADVTLSTPDGSSTLPKAFHYAASITDYSSTDTFSDVLFDKARNQLYLTAGDHVDVFSLASNSFTGTITPNSFSGQRSLSGLALTPDGSKLVVGNNVDNSIAVVDANTQNNLGVFALPTPTLGSCSPAATLQIATTNDGRAAVSATDETDSCLPPNVAFVDLTTGATTTPLNGGYFPSRVAASSDGSAVASSGIGGMLVAFHTADSSISTISYYDEVGGTISGDGNVFADGNNVFTDSNLNVLIFTNGSADVQFNPDYPAQEILLNNSGSLAYTGSASAIELVDVAQGTQRLWVTLKEKLNLKLPSPYAIDDEGKRIFALTDKGLTIVELDAVPLSIGGANPASASVGDKVTIRGSGFDTSTTALIDGVAANAVFVDSSTLQITVPDVAAGAAEISVSNASGTNYKREAVFVVK